MNQYTFMHNKYPIKITFTTNYIYIIYNLIHVFYISLFISQHKYLTTLKLYKNIHNIVLYIQFFYSLHISFNHTNIHKTSVKSGRKPIKSQEKCQIWLPLPTYILTHSFFFSTHVIYRFYDCFSRENGEKSKGNFKKN